jgi:hypothetical protein
MNTYFESRPTCAQCLETGYVLTSEAGQEVLIRCSCKNGGLKSKSPIPRNGGGLREFITRPLPTEWFRPDPRKSITEKLEEWREKIRFAQDFWASRYFEGRIKA